MVVSSCQKIGICHFKKACSGMCPLYHHSTPSSIIVIMLNFRKIPDLPFHHSNEQIKAPSDFLNFRSFSSLYKSISFLQRIHKCSYFFIKTSSMFIFVWSQISKIKAFIYVLSSRERIHQCSRIKDNNAPGVPEEKISLET